MADLLGSILNSMDKPPSTIDEKQKNAIKKQREVLEKQRQKERESIRLFRVKVEAKISEFIKNSSLEKYKFKPMEKVHRSVVHDAAEVAGLTSFSFGQEEVDRHVMIFKKEFAPSDDELSAYRRGEEWDPEKHKAMLKQMQEDKELEEKSATLAKKMVPNSNYKEKYEKFIGKDAALDAAKITTPNKQFGFVPSENKKDQRSIEQTLADIRAKKKQKTSHDNESNSGASTS